MKQYIFIFILLAFTACSSSNEGPDTPPDPEGTTEYKMLYSNISGIPIGYGGRVTLTRENQFWVGGDDSWRFVSVGPVDCLGDITKIPKSGWTKEQFATPGNGYVIVRANGNESIFARIYVIDYVKEGKDIVGIKIKVQDYFNGDETEIKLSAKSVVLDESSTGGMYNTKDLYLNHVSCKIEAPKDYVPSLRFEDSRLRLRIYQGRSKENNPTLKFTSKGLKTEELAVTVFK